MSSHGKVVLSIDDMPERGIYLFDPPKGRWVAEILRDLNGQLLYLRYYQSEIEAIQDFNWDPFSGITATDTAWFAYTEVVLFRGEGGLLDGHLRLISDDTDGIAI